MATSEDPHSSSQPEGSPSLGLSLPVEHIPYRFTCALGFVEMN